MKRTLLFFYFIQISFTSFCQTLEQKTKLENDNGLINAKLGSHISSFPDLIPPRPSRLIIPLGPLGDIITPIGKKRGIRVRVGSFGFRGNFYSRKNDKQNFAGIKVKRITYYFYEDTLTTIYIDFKNKRQVITAIKNLSVIYGKPFQIYSNGFPIIEYESDEEKEKINLDEKKASWGNSAFTLSAIPSKRRAVFRRYISPSRYIGPSYIPKYKSYSD